MACRNQHGVTGALGDPQAGASPLLAARGAAGLTWCTSSWPPPPRRLLQEGWDGTWEGLDGRNVILFIEKHRKVEEASQKATNKATKAAGKKVEAGGGGAAKAPKAAAPKQRKAAAKKVRQRVGSACAATPGRVIRRTC